MRWGAIARSIFGAGLAIALCHSAGEMVRKRVSEGFEADETHELIHILALLREDTPRYQPGLDIPANGQPWEKIRILKDESTLSAWL